MNEFAQLYIFLIQSKLDDYDGDVDIDVDVDDGVFDDDC